MIMLVCIDILSIRMIIMACLDKMSVRMNISCWYTLEHNFGRYGHNVDTCGDVGMFTHNVNTYGYVNTYGHFIDIET